MGLFDMLKRLHPDSKLFGFLNGPHGIFTNNYIEIQADYMGLFRNTGGFDMIRKCHHTPFPQHSACDVIREVGAPPAPPTSANSNKIFVFQSALERTEALETQRRRHNLECPLMREIANVYSVADLMSVGSGRHKIETPDQFKDSLKYCAVLQLDGLVVIGGDDSNTNACLLAEYFASVGSPIKVIGCPKTIDGDLQNEHIPVSFGFDTATKVYSEAIGNLCTDVASSKEYYHFVRLMGRSASHIALECALRT